MCTHRLLIYCHSHAGLELALWKNDHTRSSARGWPGQSPCPPSYMQYMTSLLDATGLAVAEPENALEGLGWEAGLLLLQLGYFQHCR